MRLTCRRLLTSAVVVAGLVVPSAVASSAAPAASPMSPAPASSAASDGAGAGAGAGAAASEAKQAKLQELIDGGRDHAAPGQRGSAGRLSRLAVQRDPGRVVISVKVRRGAATALAAVTDAARADGGQQRRLLRQVDTVTVQVPEATAEAYAARMRGRADVERVDTVARRTLSFVPDDTNYPATAGYLDAVRAPAAWDVHRGDPAVRIAVVDSGIDVSHPDLAGRVVGTFNAVTGGADVDDAIGHGTFVAGVAAATGDNGIGIAGASMGASVLGVKVADDADEVWSDAVAAGIIWSADHDAKVVNLSLGSMVPSAVERDAVAYAIGKGALVVAAAGNEAGTAPEYPAAYPGVVAVGATDAAGRRAPFSQYGSWVSVAAPGTRITGTAPTAGSALFQPGYDVADGTSFSTPLVAAEAALLWSTRPSASASLVRQAVVGSAHGYTGLGLGTGQVDFRAAMDALPPDSVPTLTQPTDGATVTGQVPLSATSTAPAVRFLLDGVAVGPPVPTAGGRAVATWPSWGASNAAHTVTAVDCTPTGGCGTQPARVGVTLANTAPTITAPRAGALLSGSATFTASAPGGGVAFYVDGVRRGFDGTAPFALAYPVSSLTDGRHTLQLRGCSASGALCSGPVSVPVSFTARSLHPRVSAVAPALISPNGDGRSDTTRLSYVLPDTQSVRFQIRGPAGTVVRGPTSLGTLTAGTRSLTWDGRLGGGTLAGNGTYTLELVTSRATSTGTLTGYAAARVRVDLSAPTITGLTGGGALFHPYPDSYQDTFTPGFVLSEPATVTLTVRTAKGAVVRTVSAARPAGRTSVSWNGRTTAGALVPAGTYYWTLTAQDPAGNRRVSARYAVAASAKRLVARTATLTLRGAQAVSAGGSDPTCAGAFPALSDFAPDGLWLVNICPRSTGGAQLAAAFYRFTLPAATSYTSLRLDSYGTSLHPSTLGGAFTRWGTTNLAFTPGTTSTHANAWRTLGTVPAAGLVNAGRQVEAALFVPNDYSGNDFDIGSVRLVVAYKVLA